MAVPSRFALAVFLVVATSAGFADVWLGSVLERALLENVKADLTVRTALLARSVKASSDGWDALADALSVDAGGRVTIISDEGAVLGDSALAPDALASLDNHALRPELADARANGSGVAFRSSTTLGQRMLYVARRAEDAAGRAVFVRLAVPDGSVQRTLDELHRLLIASGLLALVLALLTGGIAVRWVSTSMRMLSTTARRMASGDFAARAGMTGSDEMAQLGNALDALAERAASSLETLRWEKQLLDGVLGSMREGVLVVDEQDAITMLNPAFQQMFLVDSACVGKPLESVPGSGALSTFVRNVRGGMPSPHAEMEVPGTAPRQLMVSASELSGESGGKVVLVFVDVTELRRLERVRRDFVANASHELRTPVAIITNAVESLMTGARDTPASLEKFLGIVERNAQRLGQLINDILELSRLESGHVHLQRVPLDVTGHIERQLEMLRPRAKDKAQELRWARGDAVMALADARALGIVVGNLVDNAIKYCPHGATIEVHARTAGGGVELCVDDNGPGIEAQHLSRIFERFYRADPGRSRDAGGTGLGLAIVKHLVEGMGGEVAVTSAVGAGTRFTVKLRGA